jgi:aarF domain-containing kinase
VGFGGVLISYANVSSSALPILRQLGAQSTGDMLKHGVDFSMLKVWAGLEARSWLQASIEDVSFYIQCKAYPLTSLAG